MLLRDRLDICLDDSGTHQCRLNRTNAHKEVDEDHEELQDTQGISNNLRLLLCIQMVVVREEKALKQQPYVVFD